MIQEFPARAPGERSPSRPTARQLEGQDPIFPPPNLRIVRLTESAFLPKKTYASDAGLDIFSDLISDTGRERRMLLPPRATRNVPTGLALAPPPGHLVLVCSRSGLAGRTTPLFVANAPGIVDPGYTGELKVLLYNGGYESHYLTHGQRIAQLLVVPFWGGEYEEVKELPSSDRGEKGFGSSGD